MSSEANMLYTVSGAFKDIESDQTVIDSEYELGYFPTYMTIEETEQMLLDAAESLKAGYELAGTSMEGKK